MAPPRNVLFITADQWRADCLSAAGHPLVRTPHLDALAGDGVRFARHYAQAAPCGPSRASLHTGMYLQNHRSGTNGTPLDARHTNWAAELRARGHDPVLFGYTDTSADPRLLDPDDPVLRSYEGLLPGIRPVVEMGTYPHAWADWLRERGYEIPDEVFELYSRKRDVPEWEDGGDVPAPLAIPAEHHDTFFMTGSVMDYVREQGPAPWVVHLSLLRPHPPWIAPEPYNALYDPAEVPGFNRAESAEAEGAQHPWLAYQVGQRGYRCPEDERRLRRLKASYYGLISEVDDQIGRLIAFLKERGLYDRTLIVFTSDHGEQMGDHWLLGKCGYFDESFHIPLIIRDPRPESDAARGSCIDAFSENVDLMPTLLDWLGVEVPVQCDGRSLRPMLESGKPPARWRGEAHWEYDFRDPARNEAETALGLTLHQCSLNVIRDERYKYVHFTALPPLFFDLQEDPEERVNRAEDPAYLSRVLEYAQRMLSWRMNHDEQTLTHMTLTENGVVERRAPRLQEHR
ncbi:MAG: alkaline phosphatase family protein [Deltaproteobacteria bacterium]|nr:alkaline phosphatase family protein [Deltaproteobacteria bacterium]MBW2412976.1 alkaline phosphatase family protein [Deltaproteobacteria bacterium]